MVTSKPKESWLVGYQEWKGVQAHIQVPKAIKESWMSRGHGRTGEAIVAAHGTAGQPSGEEVAWPGGPGSGHWPILLPCCALCRVDPWECYQDTWQTTCSVLEHHRDLMKVRQPLHRGCTWGEGVARVQDWGCSCTGTWTSTTKIQPGQTEKRLAGTHPKS